MASPLRTTISRTARSIRPARLAYPAFTPTVTHTTRPAVLSSRGLQTGSKMASTQKQEANPSFEEKLSALNGFLDRHKTKDMKVRFIYDRESYKETEIDNDAHVNVSADGTDKNDGWVSIAGKARRVTDESMVAKLYNPTIKAWFGDKGDGIHTGEPSDPRMAVLEVVPDEIRHYHQERSSLGVIGEVVAATVTGNTASPGSIRTITREDLAGMA